MDIAYQLLKESAEGNWGFMNWPKTKPHKEYSSEALGNPSPPAGVTHLYPEGESEAWSILPNILPFFRNSQGRLDHRPDEELQTAVSSNLAHENVHEGLHSIDEIYGNASQDEYPADISGYLVEMRNKHQQWKNGELPNFGHRRLIEQFTEGMEPEEIAMNEASAQAKRQAQMGDKQNVSGFNVNHFDSDGNLVETGEPMEIAMRLLKEKVHPGPYSRYAHDYTMPTNLHPDWDKWVDEIMDDGTQDFDSWTQNDMNYIGDSQSREEFFKRANKIVDYQMDDAPMETHEHENNFRDVPFNEETGFTRSEPMDIAMRLLKNGRSYQLLPHHELESRLSDTVQDRDDDGESQMTRQALIAEKLKRIEEKNDSKLYYPSLMADGEDASDGTVTQAHTNFSDEFQDVKTGEPMDIAMRLLKEETTSLGGEPLSSKQNYFSSPEAKRRFMAMISSAAEGRSSPSGFDADGNPYSDDTTPHEYGMKTDASDELDFTEDVLQQRMNPTLKSLSLYQLSKEKLCPKGKAAAKRKFDVYPSAYANGYAVQVCQGKIGVGKKKKGGKK